MQQLIRAARQPSSIYLFACLIVVLLVLGRAHAWDRAMQAFDKAFQPKWSIPSQSGTGNNRLFLENDSYYWVGYAQDMVATGQWRIRYTYADNVPYGREVHWSQSITWLLVAFGHVRHLLTGEPMFVAIEGASIWVNPFLLVFFAIGFSWLIARRMGVVAAIFFALTFVTQPKVDWMFHQFHLGHRGLHIAVGLGTVLCLVLGGAGWVTERQGEAVDSGTGLQFFRPLELMSRMRARRWFVAAGIFTGVGLWVGATIQFFSIVGVAAAFVLLVMLTPGGLTSREADYAPELWRTWGIGASITAFAFYLVEYFPNHMAMRLEVNNPFYIVAVFCIAVLIAEIAGWRLGGWRGDFSSYLRIVALIGGTALVPVLYMFGPVGWHNIRDIQTSRLSSLIEECRPYLSLYGNEPLKTWFFNFFGVLPFFLLGPFVLSGSRRTRLHEWAGMWLSFILCLYTLVLTLWLIRWAGFHAAMCVWLMVVVGHIAWRNVLSPPVVKRHVVGVASLLGVLVLGQAVYFAAHQFSDAHHVRLGNNMGRSFVEAAIRKHFALGMRAESGGKPMLVMGQSHVAATLYYFGGISTVTSFYWENVKGLHDATAFFTDDSDATARRIAQQRGITHIIVPNGDELAVVFNYIKTGSMSFADARQTLLARLGRGKVPHWIALDKALTEMGHRQFIFSGARGDIPTRSLITVYRLEPSGSEEQSQPR